MKRNLHKIYSRHLYAGDIISNGEDYGTVYAAGGGHILIKWNGSNIPSYYPSDVLDNYLAYEFFELVEDDNEKLL